MGDVVAFATFEHVLLNVVASSEEAAASGIRGGVLAVWASNTLGDRGLRHESSKSNLYEDLSLLAYFESEWETDPMTDVSGVGVLNSSQTPASCLHPKCDDITSDEDLGDYTGFDK